jgi:hypothetical protein
VRPPSIHSRLRNTVTGLGARYLLKYILADLLREFFTIFLQLLPYFQRERERQGDYPGIKEEVKIAFMRSSLESN